ncbi:hypothetical protein, partial [Sphingomonas sp. CCH18-B1]|uniref:hypothetical protein n=1 Tax=Sphingomonas sp. CCH18-B1 TaxID=1768744 RepID=UPI001E3EB9A9
MTAATTTPEPPKGTVRLWLDRWGDYICQVDPHPTGEVSVRARGVIFGGDLGAAGGGACPTTSSFDLGGHR